MEIVRERKKKRQREEGGREGERKRKVSLSGSAQL